MVDLQNHWPGFPGKPLPRLHIVGRFGFDDRLRLSLWDIQWSRIGGDAVADVGVGLIKRAAIAGGDGWGCLCRVLLD